MAFRELPAVSVKLESGQAALQACRAAGALHAGFKLNSRAGRLFLPVKPGVAIPLEPGSYLRCRHKFSQLAAHASGLREAVGSRLSPPQLSRLTRSYDVVGDIAVLAVPSGLKSKRRLIAQALLESNPRLKVVVEKAVTHGDFRVRLARVLAGEKRTTTVYRENGCTFQLDLAKAYFSTRLGFERKRVADLVGPGEKVLVLFAGVGPFAVPIAAKLKRAAAGGTVVAVEWNPDAARMLALNAAANRVQDCLQVLGEDANKVVASRGMKGWADRIVMPLLHESVGFFPKALSAAAPGCTVHVYGLVSTRKGKLGLRQLEAQVRGLALAAGRRCRVANSRFCGAYAPRVQQASLDVLVR